MAVSIKIDTSDLEKFKDVDMFQLAADIGDAVAQEAVLPMFRNYPLQSGKKQPFKSDKARKYFFMALKKGKIQVPYQRTQALAALWEVTTQSRGVTKVTSKRKNAKYVIGMSDEQSVYHKGNWLGVEEVAEKVERESAATIAERVTQAAIEKAGLT